MIKKGVDLTRSWPLHRSTLDFVGSCEKCSYWVGSGGSRITLFHVIDVGGKQRMGHRE